MALESTTCGIVHHTRRTRAHCPTMVSSFKLSSGTICLLEFSCRAGHISVRDAQCHRWYSLVPSVPNSIIIIICFKFCFVFYLFYLFIYLFNSDPRSITEKKNKKTHQQKKQNKIKQQNLHRMIQIPKI